MKSRSIRYVAPQKVDLIEIDVPDPGPGEVQIRGSACGLCAWDLYTFRHGPNVGVPAPSGHEGVGRVIKIGPGVQGVKEGQRVVGQGFADLYNSRSHELYPIPDDSKLPDEHWIVEPASCVVTGVDLCYLKPGDRVAVVGCGFMGLMMIQLLGRAYVDRLIAIDVDPKRLELAKTFGATEAINSAAPDFDDRLAQLKAQDIDIACDTTGVQRGLDIATKITRTGGRINLFGWNHGPTTFSGDAWHLGGFTVVNSSPMARIRDPFPATIRLIHAGVIDLAPLVTHVAPLTQLQELLTSGINKTDGYIKGVAKIA